MSEDMFVIGTFFFTVIVLVLGVPLVRAHVRRQEGTPVPTPLDSARDERLARLEHAVEAVAVEVERISEGQRFVTRLLTERDKPRAQVGPERDEAP